MSNLLVLYSGDSMTELEFICGSSDPAMNMLFAEMMKDRIDEDLSDYPQSQLVAANN